MTPEGTYRVGSAEKIGKNPKNEELERCPVLPSLTASVPSPSTRSSLTLNPFTSLGTLYALFASLLSLQGPAGQREGNELYE